MEASGARGIARKIPVQAVPTTQEAFDRSTVRHLDLDQRVTGALKDLARLQREATLSFALRVAEVVIQRLFGGDIRKFGRRGPKDVALSRLAEHPDLPLSRRALYSALGVYELYNRLGEVRPSVLLGYSHYEAVLPAPKAVQPDLLLRATYEAWPVRALKAEVAKLSSRKRRGGRKPTPAVVKAVRALTRDAEHLARVAAEAVSLGEEDQAHLRRIVEQLRTLLAAGSQAARFDSNQDEALPLR